MTDDPRTLVSTDWLAARLRDPDIRVIDASWHMPAAGRDALRSQLLGFDVVIDVPAPSQG